MPDSDFVSKYREAITCYSDADFETIFERAGIEGQELQNLGKDFLGIAGALYLSAIERQSRQTARNETLKHLAHAQRSSRNLAESLSKALQDKSMIGALTEASLAARVAYPDEKSQELDSYKILDSIFPLSGTGKGFRYDGLNQALTILAECIALVEADAIEKPVRGRKHAMRPWMLLMFMYWVHAKNEPPRSGHYDPETAEYDSPAMASLALAAERLDPELTSRTLASIFGDMSKTFTAKPEEPAIIATIGFSEIIAAKASVSSSAALERYLEMPEGFIPAMQEVTDSALPSQNSSSEKSIISKEEFFETLKSSNEGLILLRSMMAIRED
ncbi:hypothetical protein AL073_00045 [Loktanella sp. 1ANDIMAR09]|nr:hypothetical protein AL073_00045 [Loktanella sp. 1ANDIMAR09]